MPATMPLISTAEPLRRRETANALPLIIAVAFFAFIAAAAIASPYYVGAPPFGPVLVGP